MRRVKGGLAKEQSMWERYVRTHENVRGTWYRRRSSFEVFRGYAASCDAQGVIYDRRTSPWYEEARSVSYFWGVVPGEGPYAKELGGMAFIHRFVRDEHRDYPFDWSHGVEPVVNDKDFVLVCPEERLPVFCSCDDGEAGVVARRILAGVEVRPVRRDDLVARWESLERRLRRLGRAKSLWLGLVDEWLYRNVRGDKKWYSDKVVRVSVPGIGRTFHFKWDMRTGSQTGFEEVDLLEAVVGGSEATV